MPKHPCLYVSDEFDHNAADTTTWWCEMQRPTCGDEQPETLDIAEPVECCPGTVFNPARNVTVIGTRNPQDLCCLVSRHRLHQLDDAHQIIMFPTQVLLDCNVHTCTKSISKAEDRVACKFYGSIRMINAEHLRSCASHQCDNTSCSHSTFGMQYQTCDDMRPDVRPGKQPFPCAQYGRRNNPDIGIGVQFPDVEKCCLVSVHILSTSMACCACKQCRPWAAQLGYLHTHHHHVCQHALLRRTAVKPTMRDGEQNTVGRFIVARMILSTETTMVAKQDMLLYSYRCCCVAGCSQLKRVATPPGLAHHLLSLEPTTRTEHSPTSRMSVVW